MYITITNAPHRLRRRLCGCFIGLSYLALSGCGTYPSWLPSAGPNAKEISASTQSATVAGIQVVDMSNAVARKVLASQKRSLFSETLSGSGVTGKVGPGDVIEVSIWEAPPANLFGSAVVDPRSGASGARMTTLPEQMVNRAGSINVPFVGPVKAADRSPQEIEAAITQALKAKANQPQVLVRIIRNASSNVTVVGEVAASLRMPLTAKGERLLDALAAAGGVRQPVGKTTLQITRGNQVQSLPLDSIIQDPRQNIPLQAGDVITALSQPLSFTVLGATGKNEELNFEAQGITLAQALARAGGLQEQRADAQGLFIFRFEDPAALLSNVDALGKPLLATPEGRIPVVYRVDLKDPAMFFVAQGFPIRNKDVLYVSNAPAAELQKFLNIMSSIVFPIYNLRALGN
ncbi:polysaccharide biosynthesis/export family protein [Rhodoferax sp. PAMC 29310]|uniref:polysaccharide biosynthesis/export family protein n=1 Tax=Rhodoferax sp. PAMC 29310 TaxID=2822760 RepID=UPI001B31F4BE|nr:polysaccharide biosynthesis/export family protein [Rhodoferax sp. PAMC 29310]